MKNIVKMIGLFSLIGFSFFYTDKVIEVIREEDEIMIELSSVEDIYKVLPVNANVLGNTIVPGLEGRTINIDESYKKMKNSGIFNKNLIVYDSVLPEVSINNNRDKFIIQGNNNKQMVSILFILDSDKYFDEINAILNSKGVMANYFVSYSYLIDNSTKIKEIEGNEFYSYGDNGKYNADNLLFSNNLISRIREEEAFYCLAEDMKEEVLELCSNNNLYTVVPTIIGDKTPYTMVKNNLTSGSMILLSMNKETVRELSTIIDYIKGKGFKIGTLSELLSEELSS
ncbi:MAG: hypothetical protein IJ509_00900 [Bacilli bacterium]|nr:hypothetical protein [Bacilli bacterium]